MMNLLHPLLSVLPITKTCKAPAGTFRPVRVSQSTQTQFMALMGFALEAQPSRRAPAHLPAGVI
jgi:hypothetical protein